MHYTDAAQQDQTIIRSGADEHCRSRQLCQAADLPGKCNKKVHSHGAQQQGQWALLAQNF